MKQIFSDNSSMKKSREKDTGKKNGQKLCAINGIKKMRSLEREEMGIKLERLIAPSR